jgi:hypothetical protein
MARNGVRTRFSPRIARRYAWSREVIVMVVLGLSTIAAPVCEGAGIARYLTPQDRSHSLLLSETGQPMTGRSPTQLGAALSQGNLPAYAAFPLSGGEHLPNGIPTLTTGPPAGETTVGPLDLTPLVQANLNATLNAAGMAVVQTPTQSFAVEYLPRYARIQAHEGSSATSTAGSDAGTTSTSTNSTNPTSLSALESNLTIEGVPAKEIAHLVKSGSNGLLQWTSNGLAELEHALKISQKATATKPSLNLAAQILVPSLAISSAAPLPAPIPEPSTWLVFSLILGAAGLRRWAGKTGRRGHPFNRLAHGNGQASASAATAQPVAAAEMN